MKSSFTWATTDSPPCASAYLKTTTTLPKGSANESVDGAENDDKDDLNYVATQDAVGPTLVMRMHKRKLGRIDEPENSLATVSGRVEGNVTSTGTAPSSSTSMQSVDTSEDFGIKNKKRKTDKNDDVKKTKTQKVDAKEDALRKTTKNQTPEAYDLYDFHFISMISMSFLRFLYYLYGFHIISMISLGFL